MIAEKWEHIRELFEQALELSAEGRQSFLADLRREDHAVADELAQLLKSYEEAVDFLAQPCDLASDLFEDLELEQHRFSPGEVLCGRFRIVQLIGQGGMGEVYKAWDEELEDYVALKTLRLETSRHELFTARFRREIQLARKVTHPNVCRIFDSFKHPVGDGTYISLLSMELLQGETLAEFLKSKGRLTVAEALPIAQQIIVGLSAIHAAGIVHRDLKPSNLVLARAGRAETKPSSANSEESENAVEQTAGTKLGTEKSFTLKITDFGIAGRLPDGPATGHTEVSKLMGTPDYMAPELLEHGRATVQSDIYSLGLILYEMVTGTKPFAGESAWKRLTVDPPFPNRAVPTLPEAWNKTITCCLERNRTYRFQSVQAVGESLAENSSSIAQIPRKPFQLKLKRAAQAHVKPLAIFFLLLMALCVGVYRYFHQSPEIPPGTMVLVTDIAVPDSQLSGITVALKSQLAQSAHFEVEEDSKVVEALKQMGKKPGDSMDAATARHVAWRSGVPLVVSGSLAKSGQSYVLSMKVERVKYNPIFPTFNRKQDFPASDPSDLLNAVHSASTWVREVAGEPEADLSRQDRPVEDTTTSSWQALQLYSDAEKKYSMGDINGALVLLGEAIKADPEFAKAHMRLADILISQRQHKDGYSEWQKAIDLNRRHHLTNRESLRIEGQFLEDTGDFIHAEQEFREYAVRYPHDYLAWFYWGSVLDSMDRKEDALAKFSEALVQNPHSSTVRAHVAMVELVLGHFDLAHTIIAHIDAAGDHTLADWLNANSSFLQGNSGSAQMFADRLASASEYWKSQTFMIKGRFFAEMGQYHAALALLNDGIAFDHEHGRIADEADKHLALAYLAYRGNHSEDCRQHALEALRLDGTSRQMEAASLLARIGDTESARLYLTHLQTEPDIYRVRLAKARLQGEIELNLGQTQSALPHFFEASQFARPNEIPHYLAYVLLQVGQRQAAMSVLEKIEEAQARILLYPDNNLPGLSADSLFDLITARFPSRKYCERVRKYEALRKNADPEIKVREFNSLFIRPQNCTN